MPDSTLSQALKEAYAAGGQEPVLLTLEMRHSLLGAPIRVVLDNTDLTASLEDDAPENPGEEVTFVAYEFDFTYPEISPSGIPTSTLIIGNVDRAITAALELTNTSREMVLCTVRQYLPSDLLGPQNDPPLTMEIHDVNVDVFQAKATIGLPNYRNKRFPTQEYTTEIFPGLAA